MNAERGSSGRAARSARLGKVAARQAARQAAGVLRKPFLSDAQQAAARDEQMLRLADDLVSTLGSMKGAAMKLGQIVSLLNFGLSSAAARDEFSQRLAPLFSAAAPVDNEALFAVIASELGARRSLLASIEEQPIAAASLGQVYRGTLVDGRRVAIKVQYPSARASVRADLKNLSLLVRLRKPVYPLPGLDEVVLEVRRQVEMELDYRREWACHRAVYEMHRGHPVFVIPEPIDELCTDRVLVTEYVDGEQLGHLEPTDQAQRDRLGEAIYRFYCGNIYTTGHFCADPHPGNIIALDDGRVAFLDFGLYIQMSEQETALQRGVLSAVMTGDAQTAHALIRQAGFITDPQALPPEMALDYMRAVAGWYLLPGVVQITDKVAYKALTQAMMPRSDYGSGIFRQRMLGPHAFSRRTEMSVCALLGTLGSSACWHDIAAEWAIGAPPSTAMGRDIARWQSKCATQ